MVKTINRNFGLDFIRAIAISLVIFSHITLLLFPDNDLSSFIVAIRTLGAIGVDLFFVLSGYLIGGIILRQLNEGKTRFKDLLKFWKRRWFRTLPNYFLVLILNIALILILNKELISDIGYYFVFLQNFNSIHPDFFTEAWSLSIEEYAYLLLPFIIYLGIYLIKPKKVMHFFFISTLVLILFLFFFKLNYYFNTYIESYKHWSGSFRKVVLYRMDSIYLGFLIIYLVKQFPVLIHRLRHKLFIFGCIIFLTIHLVIYYNNILPQLQSGFYVFLYLPLVILSMGFMFPFFTALKTSNFITRIIRYISTRSYAIYLVNYSIVLLNIEHYLAGKEITEFGKYFSVVCFIVLTLILSELIYAFFEKPILKYRDLKYK